jgi:hypothetical protein
MRRLLIIGLMALCSQGAISVATIADISGTGSPTQLATTGVARWIVFQAPSTNSSNVRVGDASITTTQGIFLAPGGTMFYPPIGLVANQTEDTRYNLANVYYLVQSGDKLTINYAK